MTERSLPHAYLELCDRERRESLAAAAAAMGDFLHLDIIAVPDEAVARYAEDVAHKRMVSEDLWHEVTELDYLIEQEKIATRKALENGDDVVRVQAARPHHIELFLGYALGMEQRMKEGGGE